MADCKRPRQLLQHIAGEDVSHVPHRFMGEDMPPVGRADAGAFLAAMLHRIQAEVGQLRCFRMPVNGDNTALVVEFIEHKFRMPPREQRVAAQFPNSPA